MFFLYRRGADRNQRDNSGYTALDYTEQRGHVECGRILISYGLQRPGSAMSLSSSSRVSINAMAEPPTLDEHGHVVFKRFQRHFSLSGESVTSMDRLPADGQAAQSESPTEEQGGRRSGGEGLMLDGGSTTESSSRGTPVCVPRELNRDQVK